MPTNHPAYYKEYYAKNKPRIQASRRAYYLRRRDELKAYQKAYYRRKKEGRAASPVAQSGVATARPSMQELSAETS